MKLRLVTVSVLAATVATTAAAAPSFVIRGDRDLGGFLLSRDGTLKAAIDAYGTPTSRQADNNECSVSWNAYGIKAQFFFLYSAGNPCAPKACHDESTLSGSKWKTGKGLRIGDSVQRMRKLYPHAQKDVGQSWRLLTRPFAGVRVPTLLATIKTERVVAFVVHSRGLTSC
jgi:hypothetical protein